MNINFQIPDLDKLSCNSFPRLGHNSTLISLDETSFLCGRHAEDDGCNCCRGNDTDCPCCTVCDSECQCYGSKLHNKNIVVCASGNLTAVPQRFPYYATEIALQYNFIKTLDNGAFTYNNIYHLNTLLLNDNNIELIEDNAFVNSSSIQTLTLHNNNLQTVNFTIFERMLSLKFLSLYGNSWKCDCTFGPELQTFVRQNIDIIYNARLIYCTYQKPSDLDGNPNTSVMQTNMDMSATESILNIDFDFCKNATVHRSIKHRKVVSVEGLVSMGAVFVCITCIVILIHRNRLFLQIWAYNRFGARCHHEDEDNVNKPYDVFIAYAIEDDRFVVLDLLPGLEQGPKQYSVRHSFIPYISICFYSILLT